MTDVPPDLSAMPFEDALKLAPNAPVGWDEARRSLDGLPGGGLNIAHEAVERQARGLLRDKAAKNELMG